MKQIIHCNHNWSHFLGRRTLSGSTWILSTIPEEPRMVGVQYVICNSEDNYCRRIGRELAEKAPFVVMPKTKLPSFLMELSETKGFVLNKPTISRVYQAIIRL